MNNAASEFTHLVFQRNSAGSDLNIQTYNVFMALDGKRSIETICREEIYDIAFIAKQIQHLLRQGSIEPVKNGSALGPNDVQQIVESICRHQGAGDNVAVMPAAGAERQSGHSLQPPDKLNEDIADIKENAPAANIVFTTMMSHIFSHLKKMDAKLITELRSELNEIVTRMQIKNAHAHAVLQWLKGQVRLITVELSIELLREVITQAYALTCGYYGPDVADRILQDAARICDEIPEARVVSPGNLL